MIEKYYFDTCIWRDHYENRFSIKGRPLGKYATKLFISVMKKKDIIYFSEFTIRELRKDYNCRDINEMLNVLFLSGNLRKICIKKEDYEKAKVIGSKRKLPFGDVLHAILAKNCNAIFVTQDKHFNLLRDLVIIKKPEELI